MIDVNNVDIKSLKSVDDLYNDAVDRKDNEAINWIEEQSIKMIKRKVKDENGVEKVIDVLQPFKNYRKDYLKKFCGYKEKSKVMTAEEKELAKQKRRKKAIEERTNKAVEARKRLAKKIAEMEGKQ